MFVQPAVALSDRWCRKRCSCPSALFGECLAALLAHEDNLSCQLWSEVRDDHRCAPIVSKPHQTFVGQYSVVMSRIVIWSSVTYECYWVCIRLLNERTHPGPVGL